MAQCRACGVEVSESVELCPACQTTDPVASSLRRNQLVWFRTGSAQSSGMAEGSQTKSDHPAKDGVAWVRLLIVSATALIPSLILAIAVPVLDGVVFIFAVGVFAYLGYQTSTIRAAFVRGSFLTAIVLFISPALPVLYRGIFANGTRNLAEAVGVSPVGFVIGIPLGLFFYALSRRHRD